MKDFSLDIEAKKINSPLTRDYFKEVISSYNNDNYRAAIVTLYSTVICDILTKLETLKEIYSDKTAEIILDELKKAQDQNPKKSDWENELIDNVWKKTKLLDNADHHHIISLQQLRHLCAHPVINKENKLYTPNEDTVRACIRNMMESLLLKPAILSKKILETLLIDISQKKELLKYNEDLEKYLVSKYLNNLNEFTEIELFRSIWKIVFKLVNEDAESNREINYRVLEILFKRNKNECFSKIKSEKDYFSQISEGETADYLIRFLTKFSFLYSELNHEAHLVIINASNKSNSLKILAWFLSPSFEDHLEEIKLLSLRNREIKETASIREIIEIGISKSMIEESLDLAIWRFVRSSSFYDADTTFILLIDDYLEKLNQTQLV